MVKYTETICWPIADKLLSVFDHFVGLAFKGLRSWLKEIGTETQIQALAHEV